ncbi:MAG: hypothetical protein ACRD44_09660, partial [Bryobacteraceae bacterium]
DDTARTNPLWQSAGTGTGHFVCVDGFGPVSAEEQAAGLRGHGEAHRQKFETVATGRSGSKSYLTVRATLPMVQEVFTRTIELVDGEHVVAVTSELESLLAFDRPVNWAEHATIGAPFLAPGVTVVDLNAGACQTRFHSQRRGGVPYRLPASQAFTWPVAPLAQGGVIDLRPAPGDPMLDHTTCAMDPNNRFSWVTALHLEKRLLIGWVWRREEFPWTQNWLNYPADGARWARGLEFSTQPFDVPRRQAVSTGTLFDTPTYRWLPAKSKIGAKFLMFYTRVPEGFRKVDDVAVETGTLILEDRVGGRRVTLAATNGLGAQP